MTADVGTLQTTTQAIPRRIARGVGLHGRRDAGRTGGAGRAGQRGLRRPRAPMVAGVPAIAAEIAAHSLLTLWGQRALVYARDHGVHDSLHQIATWQSGAFQPADMMEAFGAKAEKRQATFEDLPPRCRNLDRLPCSPALVSWVWMPQRSGRKVFRTRDNGGPRSRADGSSGSSGDRRRFAFRTGVEDLQFSARGTKPRRECMFVGKRMAAGATVATMIGAAGLAATAPANAAAVDGQTVVTFNKATWKALDKGGIMVEGVGRRNHQRAFVRLPGQAEQAAIHPAQGGIAFVRADASLTLTKFRFDLRTRTST